MRLSPSLSVALVVASAVLSAGCSQAVDEDDVVASTASALAVGTGAIPLAVHGGDGGSPADVACDPGDVAVGLYGSSQIEQNLASLDITPRRLVTRVGLLCAHVESDGRLPPPSAEEVALGQCISRCNNVFQACSRGCAAQR